MKKKQAEYVRRNKIRGNILRSVKIILASGSPRRKEILKAAGFNFGVIVPRVSERMPAGSKPSVIVKTLALRKAEAVAGKISLLPSTKPLFVVGADTIVVLGGKIIGKPRDAAHAKKILKDLSGSRHYVYTGVAVIDLFNKKTLAVYEKTAVIFKKLSDDKIENVMHSHLDKAGAYSIQEEDDMFVKRIEGDYLNVVGFPLKKFTNMIYNMLKKPARRKTAARK